MTVLAASATAHATEAPGAAAAPQLGKAKMSSIVAAMTIKLDKGDLGLNPGMTYSLYDIWGRKTIADTEQFILEIPADAVVFIRYGGRSGEPVVR